MKKITILPIPVPAKSSVVHSLPRIDFGDAFKVEIDSTTAYTVDQITWQLFTKSPAWVDKMLRFRNALVRPFGLKTEADLTFSKKRERIQPGDQIGIFKVFSRTDEEVLMGENDKHLDFRVSVLLEQEGGARWAVVSTVVQFHNWFGRLYFTPVKPFHRLIVPAMMRYGMESN